MSKKPVSVLLVIFVLVLLSLGLGMSVQPTSEREYGVLMISYSISFKNRDDTVPSLTCSVRWYPARGTPILVEDVEYVNHDAIGDQVIKAFGIETNANVCSREMLLNKLARDGWRLVNRINKDLQFMGPPRSGVYTIDHVFERDVR